MRVLLIEGDEATARFLLRGLKRRAMTERRAILPIKLRMVGEGRGPRPKYSRMLSLKTVESALMSGLRSMMKRCRAQEGRWHQIAAEIGVTPEALYRELAAMRSSKKAKYQR